MPVPLIKQATRLLRKRKFSQVVALLEPKILHFRGSFQYYLVLGMACLYTGDFGGANSYLSRAKQLNANDTDCQLAVAALNLLRSNVDESLKTWLDVLDRDKRNKTAIRALNLLRRGCQPADIYEDPKRREAILPLPPRKLPILAIALCLAGASLIAAGAVFLPGLIEAEKTTRLQREGIELSLDKGSARTASGEYRYQLSAKEVEDALRRAKDYFNAFRDNLALKEINRLLGSNASQEVKNVAALLRDYVQEPDFSNFRDNFTLAEIVQDPPLYDGCFVLWKGKIANLSVGEERLGFTFLVGYHDERQLEGTVAVSLGFAADIRNGDNYEILARIDAENDRFSLLGKSIHELE